MYLAVALVATMVFASCSSTQKAKDEGADLKAKIENCSNPDSLKVYVEQAKAYADKLVSDVRTRKQRHIFRRLLLLSPQRILPLHQC